MVGKHIEKLVAQSFLDLLFTLAIGSIVTFDELYVKKLGSLSVEVAIHYEVFLVKTEELLVVQLDRTFEVFIDWKEVGQSWVPFETKLSTCTSVRLDWISARSIGAIWILSPFVMIEHNFTNCRIVKKFCVTVITSESHGNVEALIKVKLILIGQCKVLDCL